LLVYALSFCLFYKDKGCAKHLATRLSFTSWYLLNQYLLLKAFLPDRNSVIHWSSVFSSSQSMYSLSRLCGSSQLVNVDLAFFILPQSFAQHLFCSTSMFLLGNWVFQSFQSSAVIKFSNEATIFCSFLFTFTLSFTLTFTLTLGSGLVTVWLPFGFCELSQFFFGLHHSTQLENLWLFLSSCGFDITNIA